MLFSDALKQQNTRQSIGWACWDSRRQITALPARSNGHACTPDAGQVIAQ
ncbi:MAG: hypothetical protein Q4A97_02015 [Comamonadaceae bacterium]|nr:hypothetical protein [Comamonadaceae bacterium]